MISISLGKRQFPLAFNLDAMTAVEQLTGKSLKKDSLNDALENRKTLVQILLILMQQGAELAHITCTVDETWLNRHLFPGAIPRVTVAILDAITEGMTMETLEEDEEGEEVDAVLEEIKKKETQG